MIKGVFRNLFICVLTGVILFSGHSFISAAHWCYDMGPTPKGEAQHANAPCPDCDKWGNCGADVWMGYTDNGVQKCCTPYYGDKKECDECVPECKDPLLGTDKQDIYLVPDAFSCTDSEPAGCSGAETRYIDCWEVPSPEPNIALLIHPEKLETSYGFTSLTHTGGGKYTASKDESVNDFMPYSQSRYSVDDNTFYMQATFTDGDKPIEAFYVWFSKSDTAPITPQTIDLNDDITPALYGTKSDSNFGFAFNYRDSVWTPYVPAISGTGSDSTDWWKRANSFQPVTVKDGKKTFSLPGRNGNIIANIVIYDIEVKNDGKKVILKYGVSFKEKSAPYNLLTNHAKEGKYNIWMMANDTFGFTPYDNYTEPESVVTAIHNKWKTKEKIRFYNRWKDSGQEWKLNFDNPDITLTVEPVGGSMLKIKWNFIPDSDFPLEFSKLVFNVYKSQDLDIRPVTISNISLGPDANSDIRENPFTVKTIAESGDIIGHLDYSKNKYVFLVRGGNGDGSVTLNVHDVGSGFLDFYITAFDDGGNIASSGSELFDFRDWMITEGGLLYSDGIGFSVANFETVPVGWVDKGILPDYIYADLSTELVGIKSLGGLSNPTKSEDTKGYMIRPYIVPNITSYYGTLKGLFDKRKSYISNIQEITSFNPSGSLSGTNGLASNKIGYIVSSGLTLEKNFLCDGKAVFFVSGNLTLQGDVRNTNLDKDACIFIVGGQVTINEGTKRSNITSGKMLYDKTNWYILADGSVNIVREGSSSVFDGLYVNGGIHSLSSDGIQMGRRLKLIDKLKFPAFVVEHHSKYGVLAKTLFGGPINMQKVEVGVKPY